MVVFRIVLLIIAVLLISTRFVLGAFVGRRKGDSTNDRVLRNLLRARTYCFLGFLIILLVLVLCSNIGSGG